MLIKKKDGNSRFCIDYRELNVIMVKNCYPIIMIELLDELHEAVYFLKLDLHAWYHQIHVAPADVHRKVHDGHHDFIFLLN